MILVQTHELLRFTLGGASPGIGMQAASSLQVLDTVLHSCQDCDNGHCSSSCSADNRAGS